jgi:hypothetical protein
MARTKQTAKKSTGGHAPRRSTSTNQTDGKTLLADSVNILKDKAKVPVCDMRDRANNVSIFLLIFDFAY